MDGDYSQAQWRSSPPYLMESEIQHKHTETQTELTDLKPVYVSRGVQTEPACVSRGIQTEELQDGKV
jgi:hypothetical protein